MKTKLLTAVAALILIAGAGSARASDKVRCQVLTIQASNTGLGIDAELKDYAKIFKQAPFNAFNTYKLVHKQSYELELNIPAGLKLPASLSGNLRFNKENKGQLELTLTISREGKKPISINGRASPNAPFFAAGFKGDNGTLVFGVVCNRNGITNH
jgi:Fe-S cluster assembly scaffold protein SufB